MKYAMWKDLMWVPADLLELAKIRLDLTLNPQSR